MKAGMKAMGILVALALAIGAAAACLLAPGYYGYLLGTLATTALVGVGLNVLLGLAGEVSLGQGGFLALGAYGVGILTTKAGLGFWEALPLAVMMVVAIAALLSIPALRVSWDATAPTNAPSRRQTRRPVPTSPRIETRSPCR